MVKEQQRCHSGHQYCSFWQGGSKYIPTTFLLLHLVIHLYRRFYYQRFKSFVLWRTRRSFVLQRIIFFFTSLLTSGIKEWIWEMKLDLRKEWPECELKMILKNTSSSLKPLGFEHVTFLCQYCPPQMAQQALTLRWKDWSHNIWKGVFGVSPCSYDFCLPPRIRWLVHCQRCNSYLAVNNNRHYIPDAHILQTPSTFGSDNVNKACFWAWFGYTCEKRDGKNGSYNVTQAFFLAFN